MGNKSVETALLDYANYMREIKPRIAVIGRTIEKYNSGGSLTGYRESDAELCLLQFRKCLELIMFASLVAHFHSGLELQSKLYSNEWNATKILGFLNRKNPKHFPEALRLVKDTEGGLDSMVVVEGAMTKEEFGKLYDRVCGKYLHASRDNGILNDHSALFKEITDWFTKLTLLLNSHWIHVNETVVFAVLMQTNLNGDVQVALFEKQNNG